MAGYLVFYYFLFFLKTSQHGLITDSKRPVYHIVGRQQEHFEQNVSSSGFPVSCVFPLRATLVSSNEILI